MGRELGEKEPPNCNAGVSTGGERVEGGKCGWKLPTVLKLSGEFSKAGTKS